MGVRSRSKRKRRRRASAAGGADLISGLGDDVLVRILELLPDAGDAVRTGALLRRWRGLWTRLPALRFASTSRPGLFSPDTDGAQNFASFVSNAIALRAAETDPSVQHLAVSFMTSPHSHGRSNLQPPSSVVRAAQRCIRDAVQHDVKSFTLDLQVHRAGRKRDHRCNAPEEELLPVNILDGLPRSAKMETMRLTLGGARVRLPAAMARTGFASLADLTLESMVLALDSSHLVPNFLPSACCPRLQKLRLRDLTFDFESSRLFQDITGLLLEAEALLELSWEKIIDGPDILKLRTPRLRVLRMVDCELSELTISAPRLEELLFLDAGQPHSNIHIDGGELPCVRSLRVELTSHAYNYGGGQDDDDYDEDNGVAVSLLRSCTAAACLDLDLYAHKEEQGYVNIIEGRIPRLPKVTALTVHVTLYDLHSFEVVIADILVECNNLKYLSICCTFNAGNYFDSPFLCNHQGNWQSHVVYCLPHLEEVEFMGLAGTECELCFMESMLTSITQLQKATISFDPKSSLKNRIHACERITSLQEHGTWACCHEPYLSLEWKPSL